MSQSKEQLEDMINGLRRSITHLTLHKETLSQQTAKVFDQVDVVFDIQTDALIQRKQCLLHQLALMKDDKLDGIKRKQEAIECSLANIQKFASYPSQFSDSQIKNSFEGVHSLMSEDTRPFIVFRSDPALLREIISQFGVILKQYGGHFADPNRPSISLPSVVEEEDDEDNITFNNKAGSTINNECNVLKVAAFVGNSSIVREWLMATNDSTNQSTVEVDTPKYDCDSLRKVNSMNYSILNERKDIPQSHFADGVVKDQYSEVEKLFFKSDYADILRPLIIIKNQDNSSWLSESCLMDENKDFDLCETFRETFVINNSQHITDNCRRGNHFNNNIFKLRDISPLNRLHKAFDKILKSDNKKWLAERSNTSKMILKRPNEESFNSDGCCKLARTNTFRNGSIFEPLEKLIDLSRDFHCKENRSTMLEAMNISVARMTLGEYDGLMQDDVNSTKQGLLKKLA